MHGTISTFLHPVHWHQYLATANSVKYGKFSKTAEIVLKVKCQGQMSPTSNHF